MSDKEIVDKLHKVSRRGAETHPERTPSTRLSMKKEPMMMRGM